MNDPIESAITAEHSRQEVAWNDHMAGERLRTKMADWLNAFKTDPFSTGADKVDRLFEVLSENGGQDVAELGKALLSHIDALMPAIERALAAEWKRGNYINGPQFGGTIEAFRAALADTLPKGEDRADGLGAEQG
jgi:hypothetical protein